MILLVTKCIFMHFEFSAHIAKLWNLFRAMFEHDLLEIYALLFFLLLSGFCDKITISYQDELGSEMFTEDKEFKLHLMFTVPCLLQAVGGW